MARWYGGTTKVALDGEVDCPQHAQVHAHCDFIHLPKSCVVMVSNKRLFFSSIIVYLAIDASGIKNSRLSYGIEQFLNEIKQEFMRLANGLGVSSE